MSFIEYVHGSKELLDVVKPLWVKLNAHHKDNSKYFADRFKDLTFETRKTKFLSDSTLKVRVDIVKDNVNNLLIGYCISTINKEQIGEIDSLYIETEYRKFGIGDELMKRALEWMNESKTKAKIIVVAEGNETVLDFYKRYGFYKRRIILEQAID